MLGFTLALHALGVALGHVVGRLEGCRCHAHLLEPGPGQPTSYRAPLAKNRKRAQDCPWKSLRMVEFVSGGMEDLFAMIRNASSQKLRHYLAACSHDTRGPIVSFMTSVKAELVDKLTLKRAYLFRIPHKFVGCLAHILAGKSIEFSRSMCRECLAERDQTLASGQGHKLHRVAVHLSIGENNIARRELEAFLHAGDLGCHAMVELMQYALASLVSRRVEAVHSRILHRAEKPTLHMPALITQRIKRPELLQAVEDPSFFAWACANLRKRRLPSMLLSFALPSRMRWLPSTMTPMELREHIYMYSSAAQTRSLVDERAMVDKVAASLKMHTKADVEERTPIQYMSVDFLKEHFGECDVLWCMPRSFLDRVADVALPGSLAALAAALQVAVRDARPDLAQMVDGAFFFQVLQLRP